MNCGCAAYSFPHRPLSGRCDARALWERAYEDGFECADCSYSRRFTERHPYGEGYATEHLRECGVREYADCPAVQRLIR
jgi:hypothetical protein